MVRIYFGCSMRGGFSAVSQEEIRGIHLVVKEIGHELASEHQSSSTFQTDEAPYSNVHIHDRDYGFLKSSEMGIFEISNPSLGVGGEISDMIAMRKPVLCLFKKGLEDKVSAYTQGKQGSKYVETPFECYAYESVEDAKKKMSHFIEINKNYRNP